MTDKERMDNESEKENTESSGINIEIEGDEVSNKAEADVENSEEMQEEELAGGELGILKKQVENLENILKEKNDEILRRTADLDNYRKRLIKETDDKIKFANQSVIKDFIPVMDNIELTLQHTEEGSPLRQGIELTIKSFKDTLSKHGVEEINSELGTIFDPSIHEAILMDSNAEYENNAITLCVQKGYILNGRVIRPAKVKVNKI